MPSATRVRRWPLRRRADAPSPVTATDPVERLIDVRADPAREAARTALPLLAAVAERLRSEHDRVEDPRLREELQHTVGRIDEVIGDVWSRAVADTDRREP